MFNVLFSCRTRVSCDFLNLNISRWEGFSVEYCPTQFSFIQIMLLLSWWGKYGELPQLESRILTQVSGFVWKNRVVGRRQVLLCSKTPCNSIYHKRQSVLNAFYSKSWLEPACVPANKHNLLCVQCRTYIDGKRSPVLRAFAWNIWIPLQRDLLPSGVA